MESDQGEEPDDHDFEGFLHGDPHVRETLPTTFERRLLSYASKLGFDRREDVVQQLWLIVLEGGATFDPRRGAPITFLKQVMRRAARDVYAVNAPAGERTRPRADEDRRFRAVSLDEIVNPGSEDETTVAEMVVDDTEDAEREATAHVDAEALLEVIAVTAPPFVVKALRLIYENDLAFEEAAMAVGVSRFTLRRELDKWCASLGSIVRAA